MRITLLITAALMGIAFMEYKEGDTAPELEKKVRERVTDGEIWPFARRSETLSAISTVVRSFLKRIEEPPTPPAPPSSDPPQPSPAPPQPPSSDPPQPPPAPPSSDPLQPPPASTDA